jgi:hypothetical protein
MLKGLLFFIACLLAGTAQAQWSTITGPKDHNIQKLSYQDGVLYGYSRHGIYRSTDEGYNWTFDRKVIQRGFDPNFGIVEQYLVDGSNHYFFTSFPTAIQRVEPNGELVNIELPAALSLSFSYRAFEADNGILYLFTYEGIYSSLDGGDNWQYVPRNSILSVCCLKAQFTAAI